MVRLYLPQSYEILSSSPKNRRQHVLAALAREREPHRPRTRAIYPTFAIRIAHGREQTARKRLSMSHLDTKPSNLDALSAQNVAKVFMALYCRVSGCVLMLLMS